MTDAELHATKGVSQFLRSRPWHFYEGATSAPRELLLSARNRVKPCNQAFDTSAGRKVGSSTHEFYSRTQKVSFDGETKTIAVLHEPQEMTFCGQDCWGAMEEQITDGLHPLYQPLRPVATCCECQKPVDRAKPHYALYIGEMEDVSQPWLASMRIFNEREIAVFCSACRVPEADFVATSGLLDQEDASVVKAEAERTKESEPQSCPIEQPVMKVKELVEGLLG